MTIPNRIEKLENNQPTSQPDPGPGRERVIAKVEGMAQRMRDLPPWVEKSPDEALGELERIRADMANRAR